MAEEEINSAIESLKKLSTKLERIDFGILRENSNIVSNALEQFGKTIPKLIEEFNEAERSVRETRLAGSRLRESYGSYSNSLVASIQIEKNKITQAKAELTLRRSTTTAYKAIVVEQNKAITEEIKEINKKSQGIQTELQTAKDAVIAKSQEMRAVNESIASKKEEITNAKRQTEVSKRELSVKESHIQQLTQSNTNLQREQDALLGVVGQLNRRAASGETLTDEENAQREQLQSRIMEISNSIRENRSSLDKERLSRFDLIGSINSMESETAKLLSEQKELDEQYKKLTLEMSDHVKTYGTLSTALVEARKKEDELNKEREKNKKALKDLEEAEKVAARKLMVTRVEAVQNVIEKLRGTLSKVSDAINSLVSPVRQLQQQFGVSAGTAAKIKLGNLKESVDSYITSLKTGKVGVSAEEIETAQAGFQAEFGGVLTPEAARGIAEEAKTLGVNASELAKARRVFMTQTMGDTGAAKAAQDKFVAEFAKKGLTSKDAMEAIGKNSELLARNGTRFATSFARAAADAKKIGVDLSKIDQVGDNIIGNFEGFLESQAELGAMGFGFDTNRLAELAETGDTGALMDELRSQLASTGKDITKLRRSEQLALSQAFGLSMEDLQRMGAPKGKEGSGEKTLDPLELQKNANESLGTVVNRLESSGKLIEATNTALGVISTIISTGFEMVLTAMALGRGVGKVKDLFKNRRGGGRGRVRGRRTRPPRSPRGGAGGRTVGGGVRSIASRIGGSVKGVAGRVGSLAGRAAGAVGRVAGGTGRVAGSVVSRVGGMLGGLGRVASVAGRFGRFVPGLGTALAVGAGTYGAFKGFNADKNATLGQKFKNAGSSALSVLTFGLLGKKASEIVEEAKNKPKTTVAAAGMVPTVGTGGTVASAGTTAAASSPTFFSKLFSGQGISPLTALSLGPLGVGLAATSALSPTSTPTVTPPSVPPTGPRLGLPTNTSPTVTTPTISTVNVDFTRLENKLDQVIRAIGSMEVNMDGNKVGKVLVNNNDAATTVGVFRQGARATL